MFTAYVGRKVAGKLIVDRYAKPLAVFKVVVNEPFRRQGVGTALYRAAEEAFGKLVPSGTYSDDAFHFWNKYRPETVKDDLRQHRDILIGQKVSERGMTGTVKDVSKEGVTALIDGKSEEETNSIFWTRNVNHLLPKTESRPAPSTRKYDLFVGTYADGVTVGTLFKAGSPSSENHATLNYNRGEPWRYVPSLETLFYKQEVSFEAEESIRDWLRKRGYEVAKIKNGTIPANFALSHGLGMVESFAAVVESFTQLFESKVFKNSYLTPKFKKLFDRLPHDAKAKVTSNYKQWRADPSSVDFRPLKGKPDIWRVSIGLYWRALGRDEGDSIVWYWVGSHNDYDKLV